MTGRQSVCSVCGCSATRDIMGEPVCEACFADFKEWRERKYAQANETWPRADWSGQPDARRRAELNRLIQ